MYSSEPTNQQKLTFLQKTLSENFANTSGKDNAVLLKYYYTISVICFGFKVYALQREPAKTNIEEQFQKFSSHYNPDVIIIELFTGRSRSVKKPVVTVRFDCKKAPR